MTLEDILKYAEQHPIDVADLIKVADIRRMSAGDTWRKQLAREIRERYEGSAETSERMKDFVMP